MALLLVVVDNGDDYYLRMMQRHLIHIVDEHCEVHCVCRHFQPIHSLLVVKVFECHEMLIVTPHYHREVVAREDRELYVDDDQQKSFLALVLDCDAGDGDVDVDAVCAEHDA